MRAIAEILLIAAIVAVMAYALITPEPMPVNPNMRQESARLERF